MDFNELNVPALNIMDYDCVIHLSYVDLNGFSCSTIIHKAREGNVEQLNTQYDKGVDEAIDKLIAKGKNHEEGTLLILITDIGLDKEQCVRLDIVNTGKVDVRSISNHHIEDPVLEGYPSWYYTNTDASVIALLYSAVIESATAHISYFDEFIRIVSAYDACHGRALFDFGDAINDGLYMFLGKLKKDDDYTRDIVIEYLTEIANVVKGGIYDWTPTDIESNVIGVWGKVAGAI